MVKGLSRAVLHCKPAPPSEGKWTKLGPCVDFFLMGDAAGCLKVLCDAGFKEKSFEQALQAHLVEQRHQQDEGQFLASNYRADAGKRYKRTRATVGDEASRFGRLVLAIVLEPLRFLTMLFLHHSHGKPQHTRPSPTMNMICKARSAVQWTLQYYSMLLHGEGGRLRLLWSRSQFRSLKEWQRECPAQSNLFRRCV